MTIHNQLLHSLSPTDYSYLQNHLEPYRFIAHTRLYDRLKPAQYLYFPTTAILSICTIIENGELIEAAVVGNDSVAGISLLLNPTFHSPEIALVQHEGEGFRLPFRHIKSLSAHLPSLQILLTNALQFQMVQMAQLVACNRYHRIDTQLARWLLQRADRLSLNEIAATHESIANLLGVRREGISKAAFLLKEAKIITYQRGKVIILDHQRLEESACECYHLLKAQAKELGFN